MSNKIFVIAEAGVNHNGSLIKAKKLIDIASHCGADAIKFQLFKVDENILKSSRKLDYVKKNFKTKLTMYDIIKKLEFSLQDFIKLKKYCLKRNIEFMLSCFDTSSVNTLKKLKVKKVKIPSGEITNYPLLKKIASLNKPVILSTGMSNVNEIKNAIKLLNKFGISKGKITVLHCNTYYPTKMKDLNLNVLTSFQKIFKNIGLSDHSLDTDVPLAAIGAGSKIIEKHFTINRKLSGPDHKSSLEPKELKTMIQKIRKIEVALGTNEKKITHSEKKIISFARKSLVAKQNIYKGQIFSEKNMTLKRPAKGKSSKLWFKYLGKKAKKNYKTNQYI